MNKPDRYLFIAFVLFCLTGCGPSEYTLRSGGDTAKIKTKGGKEFTGELICLQDNSIYLSTMQRKAHVFSVAINDVESIEIEGYANRRWVVPVILFQAIPTVLLTIAAASADFENPGAVFFVFALPTALTYIAFEASTPAPPRSARPTAMESIEHLRKYTRFPQGLTPMQLQQLLELCGQTEPEVLN